MMSEGLSIADAMALLGNKDGDCAYGANGTWIWIFFLFFLLAWGGNGFGFGGGNGAAQMANTDLQGALTRADLYEGFANNDIQRQVQGIQQGIADSTYALNNTLMQGFNGVNTGILESGYAVQTGLMQNRYDAQLGVQSTIDAITQAQFAAQLSACQTNQNIDAVRYDAARNAMDVVNAIREDGAATRQLITQNALQDLRDKLEDRDRELTAAQMQISQQAQTAAIVEQVRPCPVPAYLTCSPYFAYPMSDGGCGCH